MMPQGVIEVRQELCAECASKAHDPCASCEHGKWGQYEITGCDGLSQAGGNDMQGMGDVVASIAQPIAKGIDKVFGTALQNCGGCKVRQKMLNDLIPFK